MNALIIDVLLGLLVLSCWTGVIGMLRMPHSIQALHYLTLPATIGVCLLTLAIFLQEGFTSMFCKMVVIAIVVLGINSVVTHATARAFRTRELGHWEPRDGDSIEFVRRADLPGESSQ